MKKIESRLLPAIEWLKNEWEACVADHIVIFNNVPRTLDEKRKIYFTFEDTRPFTYFDDERWSRKASDIVTATVLSYDKRIGEAESFFCDEATSFRLIISFDELYVDRSWMRRL
jgi:hypothetical protein